MRILNFIELVLKQSDATFDSFDVLHRETGTYSEVIKNKMMKREIMKQEVSNEAKL